MVCSSHEEAQRIPCDATSVAGDFFLGLRMRRPKRFTYSLSETEWEELEAEAAKRSLNKAGFLRQAVAVLAGRELGFDFSEPQAPSLNGTRPAKVCKGRESDPNHACNNTPYKDYDQCRGCSIADGPLREQRKRKMAEPKKSRY